MASAVTAAGLLLESPTFAALAATAVLVLLAARWLSCRSAKNYPGGPWGFPVVGHLPLMGSQVHLKLTEWAKVYGPVYRIQMGSHFAVVISEHKALRQAYVTQSDDFAARPDFYSFRNTILNGLSMTFGKYGPHWKSHKAIARNALAVFTQKRTKALEAHVVEEADTVVEEMLTAAGPTDPSFNIHVASSSIVYTICFDDGERVRTSPAFCKVLRNLDKFNESAGAGTNMVDLMPWAAWLFQRQLAAFRANSQDHIAAFTAAREAVARTRLPGQPRNLADVLGDVVDSRSESQRRETGLTDAHIFTILGEVMGAGGMTIPTIMRWAILHLIEYPDVQRRVHEEIDRELGGKAPSYEDRLRLPYCEAVLFETMRARPTLPFLIPHATTRDCRLLGYDIPEGAVVLANTWSINHDPSLWANPTAFDPTRFLLPGDGQIDRDKTELVPTFGLGKRRCPGELLGRLELFVFFVRLLQRCRLSKVEGDRYDLRGTYGFSLDAKPFRIDVQPRE